MKKLCVFMSVCMLLAGGLSAAITKGPYIIYANNASAMTVLWQTDAAQTCTLQWGTSTSYSSGNVSSTEINSSHQHKKTITGLAANTMYYYKVTIGSSTYTGSFRSAPSSFATDVKFLVYGDTRSYPANHNSVASRIVSTLTSDSAYQTFLLHVGDWCNDGQSESSWTSDFFPRNQSSILSMQSKIPIVGTMGNHEGNGTLFKKYFPYPFVADRYWSFDYGPMHVSVVDQCMLSTSDTTGFTLSSTQKTWLTNDLKNTSKKWKVILVHHPGYSAGGSHVNNDYMKNTLHPIFKQHGVTAVFGGHNHYYARALKDEIHYVTTGGGGAPQNTPDSSYPNIVTVNKTYEFCKIAISGDSFVCKAVKASDGSIIDEFTVTKSSGGVNNAAYVSQTVPASMVGGQTASVTVRMKNTGTSTWSPAEAQKLGSLGDSNTWGLTRVYLTGSVAPNQTNSFTFNITAPATAGNYSFQWRMVDDAGSNIGWFGANSALQTITVSSGAMTTVPWVTNMTVAAAGTSITNAGLVVSGVNHEYHATVAAGRIFSQTPGGGTSVARGSSVALAASLGPQPQLVLNNSFETNTASWTLTGSAARSTTTHAGSGVASLRINTTNGFASQPVTIVSGKTYDISVYAYVSARTAGQVVFDTGDKYDGTGQGQFVFNAANGGWNKSSGVFTATNTSLTVRMFAEGFAGTAYFDLIELKPRN